MKIDHRQWTVGGTKITNFRESDYPIYRKAMRKYHKQIRGRRLKVVKDAFYGDYAQFHLSDYYSLHQSRQGDLSAFWRIYDNLKHNK